MKTTIRQKMAFGYAVMVFLVIVVSLYTITQLNRLNGIINTALTVDSKMFNLTEDLINSLFAQVSHEKKFLITKDITFQGLFEEKSGEFQDILNSLNDLSSSKEKKDLIGQIRILYAQYLSLVRSEFKNANQGHRIYEDRKQVLVDAITEKSKSLTELAQVSLNKKIIVSQKVGLRGARLAVIITILAVVFGSTFGFFITQGICLPVQRLKEGTYYIAQGDFSKKIEIKRQDEIGDLSDAFNTMCDRLRELEQLKSDFVSNITHDLKTPLSSIAEANQIMLDGISGLLSPQQSHLLSIIQEDTSRLSRLIDNLLDLSKMEAGMIKYDLEPGNISPIIKESLESVRLLAMSKKIRLEYFEEEGLFKVLIDGEKIEKALINLLSNAIKFTPEGGDVKIEAKKIKEFPSDSKGMVSFKGGGIKISISDNGLGINREDTPRVFDKFYQTSSGSNKKGGAGLGLTIARHIIQAHGGQIWLESEPGKGSTFYLLLPSPQGEEI
jgi:two-component system, NtrC family, sensor histidine kinase GlrK